MGRFDTTERLMDHREESAEGVFPGLEGDDEA